MPTTDITITSKQGRPDTSYDVKGADLCTVTLQGLDNLPTPDPKDPQSLKKLISSLQNMKAQVGGAAYRLNIILEQLNERIAQVQTTIANKTGGTTTSSTVTTGTPGPGTTTISSTLTQEYCANFIFPAGNANTSTSNIYFSTPVVGTPILATISSIKAPAGTGLQVDVQVSPDNMQTWHSIFASNSLITLPVGKTYGQIFNAPSFFSGFSFNNGNWARAIIPTSSASSSATQVAVQVFFL